LFKTLQIGLFSIESKSLFLCFRLSIRNGFIAANLVSLQDVKLSRWFTLENV